MARANATYYATRDPFRDFTTAPEIGQVFGELLGAWVAVVWQHLNAPDPVLLVEAGPGRGTLMQDVLRVGRVAPAFRAACRVHFIETSPRLRAAQAARVPNAVWHDTLQGVPDGPMIVLANEFLDALPVRQWQHHGGAWLERHVQGGASVLIPAAREGEAPEGTLREGAVLEGAVLEENAAAAAWMRALASRIARQGGAALVLDYGRADPGFGNTLQALRDGRPADPLAAPGEADLTALVDFAAMAEAARGQGAACYGPVEQGRFLQALGLRVRTGRLAAANPARADALWEAADRLASPARMGSLFKAMAVTSQGGLVPPGFDA